MSPGESWAGGPLNPGVSPRGRWGRHSNASVIAKLNTANSTNFGTFMSSTTVLVGYAIALATPYVFRGTLLCCNCLSSASYL